MDREFLTKGAFDTYVRGTLAATPLGLTRSEFLYALFQRHPSYESKSANGVFGFLVERDWRGNVVLHVKTRDGYLDFSWRKCISGKDMSVAAKLTSAMRYEVRGQVDAYKETAKDFCSGCGSRDELEVDHAGIPFRTIRDIFLTKETPGRKVIELAIGGYALEDAPFKREWVAFHKSVATYQILCRKCNLNSYLDNRNTK